MTKLDQLIDCIHNTHVYVQMHNYPDQDALASAMGLQTLLKARDIESTIIYHGLIDKDNTLKMIELLNMKVHNIDSLNFQEDSEIIIVDGQKGNINMSNIPGEVIACIDHHHIQNAALYRFFDIRADIGACSSIITSYFLENQISITTNVATALFYGLKMDTASLSRSVSSLDIDMFCYLIKNANYATLRILDMSSLKLSDLTNYQQVLSGLRLYGNIAIANIGNDCPEAIIASVNDFLLTISEIEFTVIHSFRDGGIKFSVRSALPSLDASEIVRQALNPLGDGGGHNDMAAGFIPNIDNEMLAEAIARKVEERIILLVQKATIIN